MVMTYLKNKGIITQFIISLYSIIHILKNLKINMKNLKIPNRIMMRL